MCGLLGCGFQQPVWVRIAGEKPLQLNGLRRDAVAEQDDARGRALDDAKPAPDGGLHDQVGDVAFGPHEALQLDAGNPEQHAGGLGTTVHQRPARAEQIEFAGELPVAQGGNGPALPIVVVLVDLDDTLEHHKHVDLAVAASPQFGIGRNSLGAPVSVETGHHLIAQVREGHLRPKRRDGRRNGRVFRIVVHGHLGKEADQRRFWLIKACPIYYFATLS